MKAYIKLNKNITELNSTEFFIYALILKANLNNKQVLRRSYFTKCLNKTNEDYISQVTASLESKGFINKEAVYGNNLGTGDVYQITKYTAITGNNYFTMYLDTLFNLGLDIKTLTFLVKLRTLAFDDTLKITYFRKDIAQILDMSYQTVLKYMKELENKNIISIDDTGIYLNQEYFKVREINHLTPERREILDTIINCFSSDSKLYKQVKYFFDNSLYLIPTANRTFDDLISGV